MLIHFPSALLPMDVVCYAIGYCRGDNSFAFASFYAMAGAVITGWLAVIFGALDITGIAPEKEEVMKKALLHGSINATIIIAYTVLAYSAYEHYPALPGASATVLIAKTILVTCMIAGNYIGGSLILKYKIGVQE
jgi:uncharacterized membrane protein